MFSAPVAALAKGLAAVELILMLDFLVSLFLMDAVWCIGTSQAIFLSTLFYCLSNIIWTPFAVDRSGEACSFFRSLLSGFFKGFRKGPTVAPDDRCSRAFLTRSIDTATLSFAEFVFTLSCFLRLWDGDGDAMKRVDWLPFDYSMPNWIYFCDGPVEPRMLFWSRFLF